MAEPARITKQFLTFMMTPSYNRAPDAISYSNIVHLDEKRPEKPVGYGARSNESANWTSGRTPLYGQASTAPSYESASNGHKTHNWMDEDICRRNTVRVLGLFDLRGRYQRGCHC